MQNTRGRLLWVAAFAVSMALLEAVVVVYLRGLLQLTSHHVSLDSYVEMEIGRETATLIMLVTVGWLAGQYGLERLAYGVFAFGLWDIGYYVWLKVLIDWPATLLDWDILFMIPLRWWGPVLSPILIAALLCIIAALAIIKLRRGEKLGITPRRASAVLLGGGLALCVFMYDALHALLNGQSDWNTLRPSPFKWPLFLLALALMGLPTLLMTWPGCRKTSQSSRLPQ